MKGMSEWFRWLTPILLGLLMGFNARLDNRMKDIENAIFNVARESRNYTDAVSDKISSSVSRVSDQVSVEAKEHDQEIARLRERMASVEVVASNTKDRQYRSYYERMPERRR